MAWRDVIWFKGGRIRKTFCLAVLVIPLLVAGCGPDTIFVRPGLDTAAQHVSNGNQLLERGKVSDAFREFNRAMELDPNYIRAYVGLGLAHGYNGDFDMGMQTLDKAGKMAISASDRAAVADGYARLNALRAASHQ